MASAPAVGAVFDIDGVLVRGPQMLPGATEAITQIIKAGIPHIFVTNSGTPMLSSAVLTTTRALHVHNLLISQWLQVILTRRQGLKS